MNNIKVLDVTLRDGGCVNDFNFGSANMEKILSAQESSGIDIIELGYIDDENGSIVGRTKYISEKAIYQSFLKEKKKNTDYVVMMDYGKFDASKLEERNSKGIDGIRLAFHKKDCTDAISVAKQILEKGYDLYMQPMLTLRYSDKELVDLVNTVNNELQDTKAFYIVDSFGEMRSSDIGRLWNLINGRLDSGIRIGFHGHNNIQLSYSNAMQIINLSGDRNIIIDSSIMGMGKGAGNLNTELLLEHLNISKGSDYRISPLLNVMDKVINIIHEEFYWGYAPEYYLSSKNHCSPTYASYYFDKHLLPIDRIDEILSEIDEEKKISFDREYAEELYKNFNESKRIDDRKDVDYLEKVLKGKDVLLVAPGKSMKEHLDIVDNYKQKDNVIVIGLNMPIKGMFDYILATREDVFLEMLEQGERLIVTSNIAKFGRGEVLVLDYANWIIEGQKIHDSSFVIALKLLSASKVENLYLAGFDGYSSNMNDNYFDSNLRFPIKANQVDEYNYFYKTLIMKYKKEGMKIKFLTDSLYE